MASCFAQTDHTQTLQARHQRGADRGHPVLQMPRMRGGAHALREVHIFVGHRDAMQSPPVLAVCDLAGGLVRRLHGGIERGRDKGVHLPIESLHAVDVGLHQLHRRDGLLPNQGAGLRQSQRMQRRVGMRLSGRVQGCLTTHASRRWQGAGLLKPVGNFRAIPEHHAGLFGQKFQHHFKVTDAVRRP